MEYNNHILAANGNTVCFMAWSGDVENNEPHEKAAKLIAAAPELLAQLKSLARAYVRLMEAGRNRIIFLGGDCDSLEKMETDDPDLRDARAAISKATT